MTYSLAHIINPVVVDATSDLFTAQPVTFETMRIARRFDCGGEGIQLYAVGQAGERSVPLPADFIAARDLTRSVGDLKTFRHKRTLPLIGDILDILYETSDADYLIYTNVDIALQPYFYQSVRRIIALGYDAFVINRRTIPERYKAMEDLPLMYADVGEKHPGWDCFVFHRRLHPRFKLGAVCIGMGWFGRTMIVNMAALARQFEVFGDLHATFHIGNDRTWQAPQWEDYREHNKNECRNILTDFDRRFGPFDREKLPGRFFSRL